MNESKHTVNYLCFKNDIAHCLIKIKRFISLAEITVFLLFEELVITPTSM